jgi:putative Ca2+/H+ antiporter (TMEM165/GDT1 family)
MQEVIAIFAGASLAGLASLCIGLALFRRLGLQLERTEYFSLAFVAGSACFSQVIFLLASVHLARRGVFIAIALFTAGATLVAGRIRHAVRLTPLPRNWKWFSALLFAPFGIVYLVNALAPEMSPDGAAYHLPFVARYLQAHGFERITGDFYASLSQGIELLFLPAVSVGGHSSASLFHLLFLINLPILMICYGRRFGFPIPAAAAAFLVFASPLIGWDGTSAYVDVAAATVMFALFYLLEVWDSNGELNLLIPIGILAGFSYATKYTGAIAVPYALAFVSWKLWRSRRPLAEPILIVAAFAAFFILPWMCKNALTTGNPLAPFANHLFPNPYVHVSFEQEYRTYLRHYHLTNWWSAPWELAVKGERLQGFFGPVFLLTPLAVLLLRRPAGRRLLLAGAIFALPWFLNIGSRFLIPALPPLALGLALAAERPRWLLPAIMIVHGLLSWYAAPVRYFDRYAPRIAAVPLRAALRIETEDAYLARSEPGYLIDRMIERQVPPGNRVFSFEPIPVAWTRREIVTGQHAAENEVLTDVLRSALVSDGCPLQALDFRFPPTVLRRVRAVQTARVPEEMWSVAEFRVLEGGRLLAPDRKWKMTGNPNPWYARLAFDGSPVTRWRSWQDAAPGMFLEVDFGESILIDQVTLISDPEESGSRVYLAGMEADGQWRELSARPSIAPVHVARNLRAEATRQLTARGIHYLLVTPAAFGANDFNAHAAAWGIQASGESQGAHLYRLDPDHAAIEADTPMQAGGGVAAPAGAYDDADPRIQLRKAWTHDPQFQEAYRHTLTYSDVSGASVSLAFRGKSITYMFTGGSNRGIAEVRIDGEIKERLDLYASSTRWQTRRRYEDLGVGEHLIEIRVTGQRNPRAAGTFVDVDALIVE